MASERTFCSECGAANDADAAFCESCGHALAAADAPVAEPEVEYQDNVEAPPAGRKFSPKILALVGIVLVAGGAYALRAPITSMLATNGKTDTTTVTSDSIQLVPNEGTPQLNDRGTRDAQFVVTPEVLERVTGGSQPIISMRPSVPTQAPPQRTQQRAQQLPPQSRTTESQRAMPLPEAPPEFPDFKAPPASGRSSGSSATADGPSPGGRIAAGSVLSLKSTSQICTDRTQQGARFTAVVQQEVTGSHGASIPAGTPVTFVVDRLTRAQNANEKNEFSVAPESISLNGDSHPISATVDAVTIKQKSKSLFGALAGAAAAAAAAKATGGDTKQTIAGAIGGGAAGAVIGNQIRGGDGCIEKNGSIRIRLGSDIALR